MEILINKETDNLMKDRNSFLLLLTIAYKTKLDDSFEIPELEKGYAFLKSNEDFEMTIQEYRTAKKKLAKWGFAEFKTTNKGTIAKLTTDKFFRI